MVDTPSGMTRLAADKHVLGDGKIWKQRWLLIDDRDAHVAGARWTSEDDIDAIDAERAGVRLMDAADELHERGLAGTVLPDKAEGLAREEVYRHILERLHRAERLGRVAQAEYWSLTLVIRPTTLARCLGFGASLAGLFPCV
jgi:hypothetical protein